MTAEHGTPDFPQFEDLLSGYEELRVHGHFDKRRTDLLSITGTGRTESVHSDVVAWLLDPTGSHGLRSSVLGAILTAGWGEEAAEGFERKFVVVDADDELAVGVVVNLTAQHIAARGPLVAGLEIADLG